MDDIPSWRRGIPARAGSRPPASPHESPPPSRPISPANIPLRTVRSAVNLLTPARPTVNRLSSFLTAQSWNESSNGSSDKESSVADSINDHWLGFSQRDQIYQPNPDEMADTLQRIAMTLLRTGQGLPEEHLGLLLHVLEGYRKLSSTNKKLDERVEKEKQKNAEMMLAYESGVVSWENERKIWEQEVKRLELVIAESKDGMEALVMARAGSLIRKELKDYKSKDPKLRGRTRTDSAATTTGVKPMLILPNKDVERSRILSPMRPSEMIFTGKPPQHDYENDLAKLKILTGASSGDEQKEVKQRPRLLPQDSMGEFPLTVAEWNAIDTSSSSEQSDETDNAKNEIEFGIPRPFSSSVSRGRSLTYTAPGPASADRKNHKRDFSFTTGDDVVLKLEDRKIAHHGSSGKRPKDVAKTVEPARVRLDLATLKENMTERFPASGAMFKSSGPNSPEPKADNSIEMKAHKPGRSSHPRINILSEQSGSQGGSKVSGREDSTNNIATIRKVSKDRAASVSQAGHVRGIDPTALAAAKAAVGPSSDVDPEIEDKSTGSVSEQAAGVEGNPRITLEKVKDEKAKDYLERM